MRALFMRTYFTKCRLNSISIHLSHPENDPSQYTLVYREWQSVARGQHWHIFCENGFIPTCLLLSHQYFSIVFRYSIRLCIKIPVAISSMASKGDGNIECTLQLVYHTFDLGAFHQSI